MQSDRTRNSIKNLIFNNINQIVNILVSFILRTVFIRKLGEVYLGINGLFTNILSVLSLAELGISTAMVYSMYKPLATNDEKKLGKLTNYYKILYRRIALIILILGIVLIPFLPYFINYNYDVKHVTFYYILYLLNSVFSYLWLYKSSIIIADQKTYLVKKYDVICLIIKFVLQMIALIIFNSFVLYLLVQIFVTILNNYLKSEKAKKEYSYINSNSEELDNSDKKQIWGNIRSLLFYQVGNIVMNNTDNILISIMIGTIFVGYYSNYSMIIAAVMGFTSLIFSSVQASLGNYNVKNSGNNMYKIYNVISLIGFIVWTFCSISLCILLQDFISFWVGKNYLLSQNTMLIIVLNYYMQGIIYPNWTFRFTTNLFNMVRYMMLCCSILNIILSIIFGKMFGIFGIFLATFISRLLTIFWYEPYLLYKKVFHAKFRNYLLKQFFYFIVTISLTLILNILFKYLGLYNINSIIIRMAFKEIICVVVVFFALWLLFNRSEEYKYIKSQILNIFK